MYSRNEDASTRTIEHLKGVHKAVLKTIHCIAPEKKTFSDILTSLNKCTYIYVHTRKYINMHMYLYIYIHIRICIFQSSLRAPALRPSTHFCGKDHAWEPSGRREAYSGHTLAGLGVRMQGYHNEEDPYPELKSSYHNEEELEFAMVLCIVKLIHVS